MVGYPRNSCEGSRAVTPEEKDNTGVCSQVIIERIRTPFHGHLLQCCCLRVQSWGVCVSSCLIHVVWTLLHPTLLCSPCTYELGDPRASEKISGQIAETDLTCVPEVEETGTMQGESELTLELSTAIELKSETRYERPARAFSYVLIRKCVYGTTDNTCQAYCCGEHDKYSPFPLRALSLGREK